MAKIARSKALKSQSHANVAAPTPDAAKRPPELATYAMREYSRPGLSAPGKTPMADYAGKLDVSADVDTALWSIEQ